MIDVFGSLNRWGSELSMKGVLTWKGAELKGGPKHNFVK